MYKVLFAVFRGLCGRYERRTTMIKELWLKVENVQKYLEVEQLIMSILHEKETERENGYRVILYVADTRNVKKLNRWVQADESLTRELEDVTCVESVKVVEKEEPGEEIRLMYKDYLEELIYITGLDESAALELMKIRRLDRIAYMMEGLFDTLQSPEFQCAADGLGALGECVSTDMCGSRFCVTGDVTSYEL